MGKYEALESLSLSIFGTQEWQSEDIVTMPSNFIGDAPNNEYIRVHIIMDTPKSGYAKLEHMQGQMMIDIFIPSGEGPSRASAIADALDKYLVGKSLSNGTGRVQFSSSLLSHVGLDKANQKLHRSLYSIPLSYFGN